MIERIGRYEWGVYLPNDIVEMPEEELECKFSKTLMKEIEAYIFHFIKKSIQDNPSKENGVYEYKISMVVEKSKNFRIYKGEWIE